MTTPLNTTNSSSLQAAEWRLAAALHLDPTSPAVQEAICTYRARIVRDTVRGMAGWAEWPRIARQVIHAIETGEVPEGSER